MDLINLKCGTNNINPKLLLKHFLRMIGFYVEDIIEKVNNNNRLDAIAEIYIIDNNYIAEHGKLINFENKDNLIIIFIDGWNINSIFDKSRIIIYDKFNEKRFLENFINILDTIMKNKISYERLIYNQQWKETVISVANEYINHNIMPVAQYTKCFYAQDNLYHIAIQSYVKFIKELEKISKNNDNYLLKYILTYTQFELNLICKQNNYEYYVSNNEILLSCEQLINKFNTNEELNIVRADILLELQDNWIEALKYYQVKTVKHCSYVYYKCGKIARIYLSDYSNAIKLLKKAIEIKPDYYQSFYQLASCYEEIGEYNNSIECLLQIGKILTKKLKSHLLSPNELEYLYKSYIKVALISQNRLGDNLAAYSYKEIAMKIKTEIENNTYLSQVWTEILKNDYILKKIKEEMYKHLNVQVNSMQ